jgi:hypothetical protein
MEHQATEHQATAAAPAAFLVISQNLAYNNIESISRLA